MREQDRRAGRAAWMRALVAMGVLLACVVGLAWAPLVGSLSAAGASGPSSSVTIPRTTKPPVTTTPPTSTKPTSPNTTIVTRTTVAPPATTPATAPHQSGGGAPVLTRPPYTYIPTSTSASTTTSTTLPSIEGQVEAPVVTVPLVTKASNGHVNPTLAWLSGAGLTLALLMVAFRLFVTRAAGLDRAPLDG